MADLAKTTGVRVAPRHDARQIVHEMTPLGPDGAYFKMMGAINVQTREIVFCSNDEYQFMLELGTNALEIANSILDGTLERILLEPPGDQQLTGSRAHDEPRPFAYEEALFQAQDDILFCIYGVFFKRPAMLLSELKRLILDVLKGQTTGEISDMDRHELDRRKDGIVDYIVRQYHNDVDSTVHVAAVPTMETLVTLHYVGLSYKSIGTMALLITKAGDDALPIKNVEFGADAAKDGTREELVESLISAKIEAIATNTLANTGAFPRYIITRIGFDRYRVIEFRELRNEYCLQILATGNMDILEEAISQVILPEVDAAISDEPFNGALEPFNLAKQRLCEKLAGAYMFKLEP
jgi:hypothetical protein